MSFPARIDTTAEDSSLIIHSLNTSGSDNNAPYSEMERKMRRLPKEPQQLVYEMTKDVALVHQYCRLREEMFIKVWNLRHFHGERDSLDDASHIVVARQGLHCIGGGRLTITSPEKRQVLPIEKAGIELAALFPQLNLREHGYCEVSRVAILPEFQGGPVLSEIVSRFIAKIIADNIEYGFVLAPYALARNYRRVVTQLGFGWTTHHDIAIPDREEYEGIKMVLSSMDFTPYIKPRYTVATDASVPA